MKAKHLVTVLTITLAGCWVWEGNDTLPETEEDKTITTVSVDTQPTDNTALPSLAIIYPIVIPPLVAPDPIAQISPITPLPVTPTTPPDTGSTNIELTQLEQQHPRYYRGRQHVEPVPVVVSLLGKTTSNTLEISIPKPPEELHGCNQAAMLGSHIPEVSETYRYNNWWLIASTTGLNDYSPNNPVYFLWARKISETEVGAVATGVNTSLINVKDPIDAKIDTGHAVIPYQWISRLDFFNFFPLSADEPCSAGK